MTTPYELSTDSNVGEIAANLPGAAALFRNAGISFCCGGNMSVADASAKRGLDAATIVTELRALSTDAERIAPQETPALIAHIRLRYHDTHRQELADLIPLARKVEAVHGDHPDAPHGLANLLTNVLAEMESHMTKEEQVLFPLMLKGGHPMIAAPISVMRAEHDDHASQLRTLEHITHGFALPEAACGSWRALYVGAEKFAADLVAHMHLENDVLFPRFEAAA
ncbi:iron-sulfur cluster repair protein YtfE [mine drainage metagenome]|uniref:Iron-sulfur cluster repair protein YtfE n=1 Tax=mine drainage metagenome TaxID=410659 RepID=A0A1J5PPZ0_9ZZZZ